MEAQHQCVYEWWERRNDVVIPDLYTTWWPYDWNPAHRNHTSLPGLFRTMENAQWRKCSRLADDDPAVLPYLSHSIPDAPTMSVMGVPFLGPSYLEIFVKHSPGCFEGRYKDPCCVLLRVDFPSIFSGEKVRIRSRGPFCGPGCWALPAIGGAFYSAENTHGSALDNTYNQDIGVVRSLPETGSLCS